MPDELKSCPWCGSSARFYEIARSYQAEPQWAIICTRDKDTFCPVGVPHFSHSDQQIAANMWNCRASETITIQDLRAENAKLKAMVEAAEELIEAHQSYHDNSFIDEDGCWGTVLDARAKWERIKDVKEI